MEYSKHYVLFESSTPYVAEITDMMPRKKWLLVGGLMLWALLPTKLFAAAHPLWFSPFISSQFALWSAKEFAQSGDWFDCAEEDAADDAKNNAPLFCSDKIVIHRTPMYALVSFASNHSPTLSPTLTLSSDFSLVHFNQLQLGLRSDGFQLVNIELGGESLDIEKALSKAPATLVDKQVQQFLQRYRASEPRLLLWQTADRQHLVEWTSDKNGIQLVYSLTNLPFNPH